MRIRAGSFETSVSGIGGCHPRSIAASTNHCAYGSSNKRQQSSRVSAARAIATPRAVAPTLSVMSQVSSSVLVILGHLVAGQQVVTETLFPVCELANPIGHHGRGDDGEQTGEDEHAHVDVTTQPDRRADENQQQTEHLRLGGGMHP